LPLTCVTCKFKHYKLFIVFFYLQEEIKIVTCEVFVNPYDEVDELVSKVMVLCNYKLDDDHYYY